MNIEQAKDFMKDPGVRDKADDIIESLGHNYEEDDPIMVHFEGWLDTFVANKWKSAKTWQDYEPKASDEFIIAVADHAERYGHWIDCQFYWH